MLDRRYEEVIEREFDMCSDCLCDTVSWISPGLNSSNVPTIPANASAALPSGD
jgi:hypothetical protein